MLEQLLDVLCETDLGDVREMGARDDADMSLLSFLGFCREDFMADDDEGDDDDETEDEAGWETNVEGFGDEFLGQLFVDLQNGAYTLDDVRHFYGDAIANAIVTIIEE